MSIMGDVHVVCIHAHGEASSSRCTISDVSAADYFGTPCIYGKAMTASKGHWAEGTTVFVPLDRIKWVNVFETAEAWEEAMRRAHSSGHQHKDIPD